MDEMNQALITVVLADDHPVLREGIRRLLESNPDIQVVGEASNGEEATQLVKKTLPDILVLDLRMPGLDGLEVVQRLENERVKTRILVLSAYSDVQYIQELLKIGVAGYLLKDEAKDAILDAIRGVARGERGWYSRGITRSITELVQAKGEGENALTGRELQVLKAVTAGMTNQEVGMSLGISDKTVEKHLESIYHKLGVTSRVEAAVYAIRNRMV